MRELARIHGHEAHGTLLLLLAMPCLLPVPGVGTVLGFGIVALAYGLARGWCTPSLPHRVAELALPRHWAQRVLLGLASGYAVAGRHARVRLSRLASPGRRPGIAAAIALMAVIIIMPIPFGNVLPAVSLSFIALGLVFRDGMAVLLGLVLAAIATLVTAGLFLLAWLWGRQWLAGTP